MAQERRRFPRLEFHSPQPAGAAAGRAAGPEPRAQRHAGNGSAPPSRALPRDGMRRSGSASEAPISQRTPLQMAWMAPHD